MKERLQAIAQRRWNDFRGFTAGQKAVTVAAVLALVVGGYLLTTWRPAATYAPLYSNLAAADASSIVTKLNSEKIPYKLADGGTEILVPQDKVDSARLTMSASGLPGSGQTGYSLLDKEGVTTSQFKQQIDYQRAVEGELAKTIQTIDGVTAASVHLSIPQQDVFNDNTQKPAAAVMLSVQPGQTLDDSQVQSVAYLVSSSVPGLTTNAVAISDSNGTVLRAPGGSTDGTVSADTQAKATQAYNNNMAQNLQAMLDRTLGPGHAAVTVNADLNFDQTKATKRSYVYDPKVPPVSQSKTQEIYNGSGANGGTLGSVSNTDSTTGTTGTTGTGGNGKYEKTSTVTNNADGTLQQTTVTAPGAVRRMSIAVLLDKSVPGLNVPALENVLKSGSGFSATRGDSISTAAMAFNNSAAVAAKKAGAAATKAAAAKASHDQLMAWVKQGVLVLLIAALIIGAVLFSRRRNPPPTEADDDVLGLDEPNNLPDAATQTLVPAKDFSSSSVQRRDVLHAAGERPQDVARALSSWLNTKDGDR